MKNTNIGAATSHLSSSKSNLGSVSNAEGRRRSALENASFRETRERHLDKSVGTIEMAKTADVSFRVLKHAIAKQFELMKLHTLYRVDLSGAPRVISEETGVVETRGPLSPEQRRAETGDILWDLYLSAFPDGTNPVYRERADHDCQCCKNFVRTLGGVVAAINGRMVSIWDIDVTNTFYDTVAGHLSTLVHGAPIDNIFLHTERQVGTDKTFQQVAKIDGSSPKTLGWEHFFVNLPQSAVAVSKADVGPRLSDARSTFDVFKRGLEELTLDAIDTVLELVAQNSLYRGEESKGVLEAFRKLKVTYDLIGPSYEMELIEPVRAQRRDIFCWSAAASPAVKRVRNTAIGTLLIDLSADVGLDEAVCKFEASVMAPANYKRPTALVTKAMIAKAQSKIEELGLASALERRYAVLEDITVNNILFVDRSIRPSMSKVFGAPYGKGEAVFSELAATVPESAKKLDKVEEVGIEDFIASIVPRASSIEALVENRHAGNMVSLIAPVDPASKNLFKWPNKFSWSYAGEVTDSVKERVKKAGGKVDGDLRCSLSWYNYDDLDLHMLEPVPKGGRPGHGVTGEFPHLHRIYYGSKISPVTYGQLDVDMNAGGGRPGQGTRSAVENITYPDRRRMTEGVYQLLVNNYSKMESIDGGFEVELEFGGEMQTFTCAKSPKTGEHVVVAEFRYTHAKGVEVVKSLPSTQSSKQLWGMQTQTFQKVNVLMLSPNYWDTSCTVCKGTGNGAFTPKVGAYADCPSCAGDGKSSDGRAGVGNKHYFFMLDKCANDGRARGFYNEFLSAELEPHRKVMEMVGAKMRTEESARQLSGLGFSSTQRASVLCRVKGTFERVVKVMI